MYFSNIFNPMKWHIVACIISFYLLPILKFFVPDDMVLILMLALEFVNIAVVFITSVIFAIKEGFKWYYPFIVMILYAPACLIYYGESMLANIFVYIVLGYVSQIIGYIIGKLIERNM